MHPAALALLLAKATLVLVAALGVTRLLHRAPAGARHLVWLAAFGALLVVPALGRWGPVRLDVLPAWLGPTADAGPRAVDAPRPVTPQRAEAAGRTAAVAAPPHAPASATGMLDLGAPGVVAPVGPDRTGTARVEAAFAGVGPLPAALALWAAVALGIGASLAASWLSVRRIVGRARPLSGPGWDAPLYEVSDRLALAEPPRLLQSADAPMPFACGLRRPTVVLPAGCDAWTPDRRRAVLLHELAHVRRRDLAGHTLARLVCAAYWFHPLVWTAARRLRAESERACDDLALTCGARPADYAEHLLDIVTAVRRDATPAAALAMARRSEFEGRMLDILDPERPRGMPTRRRAAALVGGLALFAGLVGAAAPAPSPEPAGALAGAAGGSDRGPAAEPGGAAPVARLSAGLPADHDPTASAAGLPAGPDAVRRAERVAPSIAAAPDATDGASGPGGAAPASAWASARAGANAPAGVDARVEVEARALAERVRERVMARAGHGESRSDDGRAELLARVLRSDTSAVLRRIAAWGLAEYAESPVTAPALAAALRADRSERVREMAAWALADCEDDAASRTALSAALRGDADAGVRATAAWALGSQGDADAADALTAALADPDPRVRTRAVWALGSVEPRRAPPALVARLGDADPRVRLLAAWALYSIEDPAAAPALERALRAERDPKLQRAYVRALAAMGDQAVGPIRSLLDSADPEVRATAVRALAGSEGAGPWPWPWPEPRPSP